MGKINYDVTFVSRAEWGARPPKDTTSLSSDKVTSHWEGPHMGSFPHSSCAGKIRGIQNFHMDTQGWDDIAYNGVACPHQYFFEGRGRGKRSAANGTTAGNNGAYAVCYLGGQGDPFTEGGKRAMKAGGDWLTRPGSPRNGHRDWKATECPGNDIYNWTHAGQPIAEDDMTPEQDTVLRQIHNAVFASNVGELLRQIWAQDIGSLPTNDGAAADMMRKININTGTDNFDETEVARQVLAVLTPEAIADAIPDTLAEDVADELHRRLSE